ncbi:MAG: ATP-binding protein, partial [Nanobdellota archaeon]
MMLNEELERVILKQQEDLKKDTGVRRDTGLKILPGFASIISGIRRCGKSTLARQFIKGRRPVYYLQFEDISLSDFELKDFNKAEDMFRRRLGPKGIYIFDEIQNVEGWERYVRQLVDNGEKVIVTGSNANMLSRELGSRLTGRQITHELYPFSFNESLRLRRKKAGPKAFDEYLKQGGFPEYLKQGDVDILRNLFYDVFYRDVLLRNDIRGESAVKTLMHYLLSNIGKEISYNKLRKIIGVGSTNTVIQFIEAFEQAYLLFTLKKYDHSLKKQMINPKKIYCIDNAIIRENSFSFSENMGRLLENTVFIELKRRDKEIYYHKNNHECDFLVREKDKVVEAVQVCHKLDSDNKDRELSGLYEAMDSHGLDKGLILTHSQEDEISSEGRKAIIKPIWKWL